MRVDCKREFLQRALDLTAHITFRAQTLPVLQCVKIEAKNNTLFFSATNLEIGITVKGDVKVIEEGITAVPAQLFLQTISLITQPTITLHLDGEVLHIITPTSKTKIKTLKSDEFPSIPTLTHKSTEIDGKLFAHALKSVLFATSASSIKPELGCVNLHQKTPHTLTAVATDSFRLAEKTVSLHKFTLEGTLLIPQKNASEFVRILEMVDENPEYMYGDNQLALLFPSGVYVVSRLVEGNFPDYQQIIPKEYQTHATLLLGDFLHALKKTNIFTNKFLQVSLSVDTDKKTVELKSENTDAGATEEPIAASIDGSSLQLSFNQRYLFESLQYFSDDSIQLSFAGVGRPLVIKGVSDTTFRYLVMPMNK